MASSRSLPLIFVRDNKEGSLRLGELVQLKIAIAIGIKVRSWPPIPLDLYHFLVLLLLEHNFSKLLKMLQAYK